MQFRQLGRSGLRVSLAGLGCNNFGGRIDLEQSRAVVHKALDLGVTLFDTADIYGEKGGSETALGEILGDRRKDIVLATKFGMVMDEARGHFGASRGYIMHAVEDSLRRLKTDWIDLYQLHTYDPLTPIEETLRALDDLVRAGKVRYIGCSNLPAWRVVEAQLTAQRCNLNAFASIQDEYSLLERNIERDLLPAAQAYGLGVLPYFPLASGMLTGKYTRGKSAPEGTRFAKVERLANRYMTDANFARVEQAVQALGGSEWSLARAALAWLATRPQVSSVIAGATSPAQVEENVRALETEFDPDLADRLDEIFDSPGR